MDPDNRAEPRRRADGRRREVLVAASFLVWAVCYTGATHLLRRGVVTSLPLAWLVAAVPSLVAIWIVARYTRYLRKLDELQRLIQLQAMGWGFGGGFFLICGYLLFVPLGAPEKHLVDLVAAMPVLFAIGMLVGCWRYR
jgi:hypothetical protein